MAWSDETSNDASSPRKWPVKSPQRFFLIERTLQSFGQTARLVPFGHVIGGHSSTQVQLTLQSMSDNFGKCCRDEAYRGEFPVARRQLQSCCSRRRTLMPVVTHQIPSGLLGDQVKATPAPITPKNWRDGRGRKEAGLAGFGFVTDGNTRQHSQMRGRLIACTSVNRSMRRKPSEFDLAWRLIPRVAILPSLSYGWRLLAKMVRAGGHGLLGVPVSCGSGRSAGQICQTVTAGRRTTSQWCGKVAVLVTYSVEHLWAIWR